MSKKIPDTDVEYKSYYDGWSVCGGVEFVCPF